MGLRDRVRRLRRASEGEFVSIPQLHGPDARFPKSALRGAFLINVRRATGENVAEHPLSVAAARSSDPAWSRSFLTTVKVTQDLKDLSE